MPKGANPMLKDAKRGTQKMPREPKGCQKDAKGGQGSKRVPKKKKESDLDLLECIEIKPWSAKRPGGGLPLLSTPRLIIYIYIYIYMCMYMYIYMYM